LVGLYPVGGVAWDYLQYVVGLARKGHDVYYHEDTWCWPYDPVRRRHVSDPDYSAAFIDAFFRAYAPELRERWHYLHLHDISCGMSRASFDAVARTADLFLNVSGASMIPDTLAASCRKVFVDTDPGYNQIMLSERPAWSENIDRWCESVGRHDCYLTYAENIDGPDCAVPKVGLRWYPTRMPIVLDLWEPLLRFPQDNGASWTTVMTWNSFKGDLAYRGTRYQSKGHEFEKLMSLPKRVGATLTVGVGGTDAPLDRLSQHGWQVLDGPRVSASPQSYQQFIAESRGEVSCAKQVYVAMRSGWFSCRSACYLAAGRPVIVQDTGFGASLPVGRGIVVFEDGDGAAEAISAVENDYEQHARAARRIACEFFDASRVLGRMLEDVERTDGA
jgi:hypothetical protein